MKNIILGFIFLFSVVAVNAQETKTTDANKPSEKATVTENKDVAIISLIATETANTPLVDKVCYSEVSKVTFYEALISQNGFDIQLKESNNLAIKSTEEIISKSKDQILYSEEE
ncbi:hypothetical protein [Aquimarina sp. 2201CG5-10]|uniref:hypothetical protein n=1 Tax=Aquimarina callyspongiae TaxID=3098150 RepID=UPI002AB5834A|nr:hypothetical protein [Aquimarina sp. 2201CG5-10]MDY8136656.1 hypothetical protein [Aquimarina sp. 2201CG5-10]